MKTIFVPSGDQAGVSLKQPGPKAAQEVSAWRPPPVVRVDGVDLGVLIGTLGAAEDDSSRPGEKSGKVAKPPRWVSWRWSEPSWCIVQISQEPLTLEQ